MALQLTIFDKKQIIETVVVDVNKEIPLDVYKYCHRFSNFAEHMDRTEDGKVIWDEDRKILYSEDIAEAEWLGLQEGYFRIGLEIPKDLYNEQ